MNTYPSRNLKDAISYAYLLSFCPPAYLSEFRAASRRLLEELASQNDADEDTLLEELAPDIAYHIAAFHQRSREPADAYVTALADSLAPAHNSQDHLRQFQQRMSELASLAERAHPKNRLHRKKGCAFCWGACRYGYFSLVSDPDFEPLRRMLEAENQEVPHARNPISVLWSYASMHLWNVLDEKKIFVRARDLGNLSYCLLLLSTARSRYAMPEKELRNYQLMNQRVIANWNTQDGQGLE